MIRYTAAHARREGKPVSAFQLDTLDGRPLCIFIWGTRSADGVDTRGGEVVAAEPVGYQYLGIDLALRLLAEGDLFNFAEVPIELRRWGREARMAKLRERGAA